MVSTVLQAIYSAFVVIVAVAGIVGVMWATRSRTERNANVSSALIVIAVVVFVLALVTSMFF